MEPSFSKRNMGGKEKRTRHSYGEWEIHGNKDKCPSTNQYLKLRLMVHVCNLQAQPSLSRIEHKKDTCHIIELSNKSTESADQQTKHQLMLFHDLTHQKGPITAKHVCDILTWLRELCLIYSSVSAWLALCSGAHHAAAVVLLLWRTHSAHTGVRRRKAQHVKLNLLLQGFLGSGWCRTGLTASRNKPKKKINLCNNQGWLRCCSSKGR